MLLFLLFFRHLLLIFHSRAQKLWVYVSVRDFYFSSRKHWFLLPSCDKEHFSELNVGVIYKTQSWLKVLMMTMVVMSLSQILNFAKKFPNCVICKRLWTLKKAPTFLSLSVSVVQIASILELGIDYNMSWTIILTSFPHDILVSVYSGVLSPPAVLLAHISQPPGVAGGMWCVFSTNFSGMSHWFLWGQWAQCHCTSWRFTNSIHWHTRANTLTHTQTQTLTHTDKHSAQHTDTHRPTPAHTLTLTYLLTHTLTNTITDQVTSTLTHAVKHTDQHTQWPTNWPTHWSTH